MVGLGGLPSPERAAPGMLIRPNYTGRGTGLKREGTLIEMVRSSRIAFPYRLILALRWNLLDSNYFARDIACNLGWSEVFSRRQYY